MLKMISPRYFWKICLALFQVLVVCSAIVLMVPAKIAAVSNAIASYLKTGGFDVASTVTAITAGIGLIKAQDDIKP